MSVSISRFNLDETSSASCTMVCLSVLNVSKACFSGIPNASLGFMYRTIVSMLGCFFVKSTSVSLILA